eukprot:g26482.t1
MVDELSALGLRHVGYGVPIELFAPFTDSCVQVIKGVVSKMPKSDRDRYYYGINDLFRFQPTIAADILQEAPKLVKPFLDGLIWRGSSTVASPWGEVAFVSRMVNFLIFLIAGCFLNSHSVMVDPVQSKFLAAARLLVYTMPGMMRVKSTEMLSFALLLDMAFMMMAGPMIHCFGSTDAYLAFTCENYTDGLSLMYEVFLVGGIFLQLSEKLWDNRFHRREARRNGGIGYKLRLQVMLCFGVVTLAIFTFGFSVTAMTREVANLSCEEWADFGTSVTGRRTERAGALVRHQGELSNLAEESPFLLVVIALFLLLVYSFFFNILVSQFCGVHSSLAEDSEGHARLSRGDVILDTLKAVQMKKWKAFVTRLALDQRTDFDEGDIGLPGGIKVFEPAGANPKTQESRVQEQLH